MNKKQRRWRNRILVAIALFFAIMLAEKLGLWNALFGSYATYGEFALYLIPYLIAGHDVLRLVPPLIASRSDIDKAVSIIDEVLSEFKD